MSSSLSHRAEAMLAFEASRVFPSSGGVLGSEEYNSKTNPNGVINMSTSENRLVFDLLKEKLHECTVQPNSWDDEMFMYSQTGGVPELKEAIATLLTVTTRAVKPLDPNKMVLLNGADGGLEAMSQVICDPGDAVLVPTPLYYGVHSSLKVRADVDVIPIPLSSKPRPGETEPFQLTVDRTEEAFQKAKQEGINVKALFLVNPNNPLGDVYNRQQLLDLMNFAKRNDLHVVLDEVYLNTIYEDGVTHYSIFQFREDELPDLEKVHFIWSLSKDLAMGGMRISVNYTWNEGIHDALLIIAHFQCVPTGWQKMMARMLSHTDWFVDLFLPTCKKNLKDAHDYFTDNLSKLGVPHHRGLAGFYVWVDFSKYLSSPTVEAELGLNQRFLQEGIQFNPSMPCLGSERGWFRVVFARKRDILETALTRIERALLS